MKTSRQILLTGSSGWLGRFLAPMLTKSGYTVTGLDIAAGEHTQLVGSVSDKLLVDKIFSERKIDAVIHAGALHKPDIARFDEQAFIDVNVSGTLNLLEAASLAGHTRFVMTSTTSLMISRAIRSESSSSAAWLDESHGPIEPRNIYGVTKLAAESLCRVYSQGKGLSCIVLRTSRFFPEEDDTIRSLSGPNLKANEFLHRRLSVEDAARAHIAALENAPELQFGVFIVSAPTPFKRADANQLRHNAAALVERTFPSAARLFQQQGWQLPSSIGRVYDSSLAEKVLGFRCNTDFAAILKALEQQSTLPFVHDSAYISPHQSR